MTSRRVIVGAFSAAALAATTLGAVIGVANATATPSPGHAPAAVAPGRAPAHHLAGVAGNSFDLEGCAYQVNNPNISFRASPGGTIVAPAPEGDFIISAPRTFATASDGSQWVFGLDYQTGFSGWIGRSFVNFDFCTSPSSE